MASKTYEVAFALGAKLLSSFSGAFNAASNNIKALEAQSKTANKSFLGLGEAGTKVFKVAAGVVGGISFGAAAKESIELASNLVEVQNVVDTTFQGGSKQIDAWSKTALKGFGLSELQAKQFNGTMGALMKSSGITGNSLVGMSENLTGLSGDFASFYNLPIEEAFDKIKSGISGETEPLKSLGINMSVANLQAFALSQGITKPFEKMSQGEQTLLRYNYLMGVSKDVQGDFNKTSNTFANQLRIAKTNLAQTGATIGSKVLPALNNLLLAFNNGGMGNLGNILDKTFKTAGNAIDFAKKHAEFFKVALLGIGSAVATIKIASFVSGLKSMSAITKLVSASKNVGFAFSAVRAGAATFGEAMTFLIGPVGIAAVFIAGLVVAGYLVYKNWDKISKFVSNNWIWLKNQAVSIFTSMGNWISNNISYVKNTMSNVWNSIKTITANVWNGITSTISKAWASIVKAISSVWKTISSAVASGWNAVVKAITSSALFKVVSAVFKGVLAIIIIVVAAIHSKVTSIWNRIYTSVSSTLTKIWQVITRIWNSIYTTIAGIVSRVWSVIAKVWNTIYSVVSGIMSRVWSVIVSIWNSIYSSVSSVLQTIWNVIVRIWNAIYTSVSTVLTTVWNFIVNVWNNIYTSVSSVVTTIWNTIVNGFNSAASGVTSIFTNMYNSIVNIFSGIWSAIKSIINGGISMLNGFIGGVNGMIEKANKIPGVSIGTVGTIPQLANGGYIKHRPGGILANIGEGREDEIVSPISKLKSLINNNSTVSSLEQPNINFTINVTVQGNASKNDIYEAVTMGKSEIERVIDEYFNRKKRLAFS